MSHKKEWDEFTRACSNRKKFPIQLSNHLQRDKVDLFNQWLACSKNMKEFLGNVLLLPPKVLLWEVFVSRYLLQTSLHFAILVSYRLELKIERSVETSKSFHAGREGMKAREIHQKYPAEKAKRLIELLRKKQLW